MIRVGFADAIAYRAEMVVWILSSTMPLVMLALWHAVAQDAPIGRFGSAQLVAYFLSMFIVRQLTGNWLVWLINTEIKDGTLGLRLLRPVHPLVSYAASSVAAIPVRGLLAIPAACVALYVFSRDQIAGDAVTWVLWAASIVGAWSITLAVNLGIGCLAFFLESSTKVMDVWLTLYFVFSGYMVPVELFPSWVQSILAWLPFRYQLGLPVELMTGAHARDEGLLLLGQQWLLVGVLFALVALLWRTGLRRFGAFGG